MCIFAKEVKQVSHTRILVAPTSNGRQLTIYENAVTKTRLKKGQHGGNAMILPCPSFNGSKVELVDLSKHPNLFNNLDKLFPKLKHNKPAYSGNAKAKSKASDEEAEEELEVHNVGAYVVSIVPSIRDIIRLNKDVFTISISVEELLHRKYDTNFAFIICAFDITKGIDPHPIGYVHDALSPTELFVPCKHEHGDGDTKTEHFDHTLFSIGTIPHEFGGRTPEEERTYLEEQAKNKGSGYYVQNPSSVISDLLPTITPLTTILKLETPIIRRLELRGKYPNDDLVFRLINPLVIPSANNTTHSTTHTNNIITNMPTDLTKEQLLEINQVLLGLQIDTLNFIEEFVKKLAVYNETMKRINTSANIPLQPPPPIVIESSNSEEEAPKPSKSKSKRAVVKSKNDE